MRGLQLAEAAEVARAQDTPVEREVQLPGLDLQGKGVSQHYSNHEDVNSTYNNVWSRKLSRDICELVSVPVEQLGVAGSGTGRMEDERHGKPERLRRRGENGDGEGNGGLAPC